MARGASRTPSRKKTSLRSASAASSGMPGWAKLVLGIAVGFGGAYLLLGKKDNSAPPPPTPPLVTPVQTPAATNAGKSATSAQRPTQTSPAQQDQKKNNQPSFDFYTILPSSEIAPTTTAQVAQSPSSARQTSPLTPVPTQPAETASTVRTAPTAPTTDNGPATTGDSYILQSLSTSSQEGANTLAERLRDLGLPTQVRAVQLANGKTTYRVQSGPFTGNAERDRALGLIRVQHLDPMTIRVR